MREKVTIGLGNSKGSVTLDIQPDSKMEFDIFEALEGQYSRIINRLNTCGCIHQKHEDIKKLYELSKALVLLSEPVED